MDHPSETLRHKCAACFRQFNKIEHLVEHMRLSFHSLHEPTCSLCHKHCRSFESLREHLIGPLPKQECNNIFGTRGCKICLAIFESPHTLRLHQERCQLRSPNSVCEKCFSSTSQTMARFRNMGIYDKLTSDNGRMRRHEAVALACRMVGGGSDGSLDICARVCLIDENETIIFSTYVNPTLPITNYRLESTGVGPEYMRDHAMPLKQVGKKIEDILCNGEPMWKIRPGVGGKARILVGHGLGDHLKSLQIEYPPFMIRDTAYYPPLMKTSKLTNSLHYLTQAYLGYDIQNENKDPYEDCVATMRLYMRMRSQVHKIEEYPLASDPQNKNNFAIWKQFELERMSPEQMLEVSRSDYYCWCLDSKLN